MNGLDFIKKLYNGRNCYSDPMTPEEIKLLHIESTTEQMVKDFVEGDKVLFLTGNPGDGKTYIIKALKDTIKSNGAYVIEDINSEPDLCIVAKTIIECYKQKRACIIAVNEYPFLLLIKEIKALSRELYDELQALRKKSIVYGMCHERIKTVVIVDLNNRSLLDTDRELPISILNKLISIVEDSRGMYRALDENVKALSDDYVQKQLSLLFSLVDLSGEHFAMRDILGAISYILTACLSEDEDEKCDYYDAMFSGGNELLMYIKVFDPVFLSMPELDEELWNGECIDGWRFGKPQVTPQECEDQDKALRLFKSIKRKYYFENINSFSLNELLPIELKKCKELFQQADTKKEKIKQDLIEGLNKLFLPSDELKHRLRIWTVHSYDLSRDTSATVSSRYIDCSQLELCIPSQPEWLKKLEYTPSHIILKTKSTAFPALTIDISFMRALFSVKDGYPINLLPTRYEQAASVFLQALDDSDLTEEYDDGEIIIADRKKSYKRKIAIVDNKYSFEEEI